MLYTMTYDIRGFNMQKILSFSAISFIALMLSSWSNAAPRFAAEVSSEPRPTAMHRMREAPNNFSSDQIQERRRSIQENGMQRLKKMRWQVGYVMPQHYRGNAYKIEYKEYNLPKPSRNQQWYKINKNYLLINADDNSIISIHNR